MLYTSTSWNSLLTNGRANLQKMTSCSYTTNRDGLQMKCLTISTAKMATSPLHWAVYLQSPFLFVLFFFFSFFFGYIVFQQHCNMKDLRPEQSLSSASIPAPQARHTMFNSEDSMSDFSMPAALPRRDPRPALEVSRQSSAETKFVEVASSQGKDMASNMEKLCRIETQKVVDRGIMATKAFKYFRVRDAENARNQRGLVRAIEGLSAVVDKALASRVGHGIRCCREHSPVDDGNDIPDRERSRTPVSRREPVPFGIDMDFTFTPSPSRTHQIYDPEQELDEDDIVSDDDAVVPDDVDEDIGFELVHEEDITPHWL